MTGETLWFAGELVKQRVLKAAAFASEFCLALAGKAPSVFETRHEERDSPVAPILYSKFRIIASAPGPHPWFQNRKARDSLAALWPGL